MEAKYLAANPVFHGRMNCTSPVLIVEIDYHFSSDRVVNRLLDIRFISTVDQLDHGFTKALSYNKLLEFQYNLNLIKM
jgi:hypothetical protein